MIATAGDFAKGFAEEQALRTTRIGMHLASLAGLGDDDRRTVFYLCLLRFVGCTATASQMAATFGDELAVSATFAAVDTRNLRAVATAVHSLTSGSAPRRLLDTARFMAVAPPVVREHEVASCEVGQLFATQAGLPDPVRAGLAQVFERFDGHGHPGSVGGQDIALPVRVAHAAHICELLLGGDDWASGLRTRAGSMLDPELVALMCADPAA